MDENQSNKTEVEQLGGGIIVGGEENHDDHHENGDQGVQRTTQLVATTSDGRNHVVSVPVSVGSLIGTSFNVITPDQLPHFKQMLCVDSNGFLSTGNTTIVGTDGGDLKGYVIHQQQPQQQQQQQTLTVTTLADASSVSVGQQQQQQQQQQLTTVTVHNSTGQQQQQQQQDSAPVATITVSSPNDENGDLQQELNQSSGSGGTINWETTNSMEVLSIRCKSTTAELYKSRLGSGGRGRCVKFKEDFYTPSEFENICGRGSSKDWKRSIRYGGRSLQALIDEGILTPHATSCTCAACCDDDSTSGPVRLFTPYKRRRRNQITPDSTRNVQLPTQQQQQQQQQVQSAVVVAKKKPVATPATTSQQVAVEVDSDGDQVVAKEEPNWQTITDGLDVVSNDYLNAATAAASTAALAAHVAQTATPVTIQQQQQQNHHHQQQQQQQQRQQQQHNFAVFADNATTAAAAASTTSPGSGSPPFDRLQSLCAQMTKTAQEFRRALEEAKEQHQRQIEKLQQERDAALLAARVHEDCDDPNGLDDQIPGIDMSASKKCANCNREAMAECSLCRRTPYCSTFCQRKDWNAHQVECAQDPNDGSQQIMLLVEDQ